MTHIVFQGFSIAKLCRLGSLFQRNYSITVEEEGDINKRKLSKPTPKPTPRGLRTLKRLNELMKWVNL